MSLDVKPSAPELNMCHVFITVISYIILAGNVKLNNHHLHKTVASSVGIIFKSGAFKIPATSPLPHPSLNFTCLVSLPQSSMLASSVVQQNGRGEWSF